ncbi:MAG TPA: class I SAM-dependent methyltransferase [Edaphobacter sp.]|nr:class I SAM-dependent methyltransferase [Edaphobacter sp.]
MNGMPGKSSTVLLCLAIMPCISSSSAQTQDGRDEVDIHAPYVATPYPVVDAMLALARVRKGDLIIDLGSGDGRIVIEAAKRYGVRGIGIDINPKRVAEAKANARREGVEQLVRFEEQNVYDADLKEATVVTLYLLQDINLKLRPSLKSQLKPGARIVSHSFDMGTWKPEKKRIVGGDQIYLWKIRRRFWPF